MAASAEGPPGLRLRGLRKDDLPEVLRIEEASFAVPWSEWAFRALFRREDAVLLGAELDGGLVGYAAVWFEDGEGELGDLAVALRARRRGVGRALVRAIQEETRSRGAERLFLQVREGNRAARRLYREEGFRQVARKRGYYRSPQEDALVLQWDPQPPSR